MFYLKRKVLGVSVSFAWRGSGFAVPVCWALPVLLPQGLDGLGRERVDTCLHVLEDVLVCVRDDELVFEDFNFGPNGKVLGAGGEREGGTRHVSCSKMRVK